MQASRIIALFAMVGALTASIMATATPRGAASDGTRGQTASGAAPGRVVSINLCTDQLAMLIAAPGQLHSVSHLAADPRGSAMVQQARRLVLNRGLAEEIYLMDPDLVVAGQFTHRATVEMLQRLGIPVAIFAPASSLADVRTLLVEMGTALGQDARAAALVADYDRRLAAVRNATTERPGAALYSANGYTSGDETLAGEILIAAGFKNAAVEAGFSSGGFLPLEILALLDPEVLITGRRYPGASRSEEILDHPVVKTLEGERASGSIPDQDWVCGTPFVLRAIEELAAVRLRLEN